MRTEKFDVIGVGALNFDVLLEVHRILAAESETCIEREYSSPGGSAANTIYGLAKLGMKTGFIGVVGNDAEGKAIIQDFESIGVDVTGIKIIYSHFLQFLELHKHYLELIKDLLGRSISTANYA